MAMTLNVSVSYRDGTYTAKVRNTTASCTWDAGEAVWRAAEKFLEGSSLEVLAVDPTEEVDARGREIWQVLAG